MWNYFDFTVKGLDMTNFTDLSPLSSLS